MIVLALGFAAAALLSLALLRLPFPRLRLENYRGVEVKVVGGAVLAASLAIVESLIWMLGDYAGSTDRIGLLILAFGFFVLGLADDLFGDRSSKGLGGHLKALLKGRVTTGAIKAVGGLGLAGLVALSWDGSLVSAIADTLAIALSANFLNLLDVRPGRASKSFFLLLVPLYAIASSVEFRAVGATLVGATAAWLYADLTEQGMLGDSGANLLGAVLGAGAVLTLGLAGRVALVVVLAGLTIASEWWSFSRAIDRLAPLRWIDRLGRVKGG